jgi:hypothetical protein
MAVFHFRFRTAASWLLVSVLSGIFPAAGADAPPTAPLKDRGQESGAGGRGKAALARGSFSLALVADRPWGTLPDSVYGRDLNSTMPQPGALLLTRAFQDPAPQALQEPTPQSGAQAPSAQSVAHQPAGEAPATAAPAKHHLPKWVWLAVVAGIAVGAGAAIVVEGHQSGKTSPAIPTVTVNVGGGSAGAP